MSIPHEVFVSVDVETSGPVPGEFSLLSIGACAVDNVDKTFACELKPINQNADPEALKIAGLSLQTLAASGLSPDVAMAKFGQWAESLALKGEKLVFVGFNAPFDWSFVNYYFHRFLARNPFGFAALDIKAFYMGVAGCAWSETRSSQIAARLHVKGSGDHKALHDAVFQAELFRLTRDMANSQHS
jgi:ribonuclease T